jgi:hypothetical protein
MSPAVEKSESGVKIFKTLVTSNSEVVYASSHKRRVAPQVDLLWCGITRARMSTRPEDLWFHLAKVETSQGTWLIAVDAVTKTQATDRLYLQLILKRSTNAGNVHTRKFVILMFASEVYDPHLFINVIREIRNWLESKIFEEYGFLDLVNPRDTQ